MNRSVLIYAGLLLVVLVGSYRAWTDEDAPDLSKSVMVLQGDADSLESIEYESDKLHLTLMQREDDLGSYIWVRAEPKNVEPPSEDEANNPHAPPPDDGKTVEFKAGKKGETVVEGMAPFLAKRTLEGVGDDMLEEIGLAEPEAKLTIRRKGRDAKTYDLGKNVYGGSNVYLRDPSDGTIYLIDAKLIRPLQTGKRSLPDRLLFSGKNKEVESITVTSGEASATFFQYNPDDPDAQYWATQGESEGNATAQGWIDKTLRLRSSDYISEEEQPSSVEEALRYSVKTADGKVVDVTVLRAPGEDGEDQWYAKSTHTRATVRLQRALAAEVAADLPSVLDSGATE